MTLWTPDGERPVPPKQAEQSVPGDQDDPGGRPEPVDPRDLLDLDDQELTPEQEEQARAMAHEMAEARARLLETEVSTVIINHALGISELAAIHLTTDDPDLEEAQLAIDALAALVEALPNRLGDGEAVAKDALHQLRMLFVQRQRDSASSSEDAGASS